MLLSPIFHGTSADHSRHTSAPQHTGEKSLLTEKESDSGLSNFMYT